jgi:hypothetical protein
MNRRLLADVTNTDHRSRAFSSASIRIADIDLFDRSSAPLSPE